jgi:LysM repeat protein
MKKYIQFALYVFCWAMSYAQPVPTTDFPFWMTVDQYISKYADIAVEEMHRSRIPASITLAQGIIESGNGNSRLAVVGNNHFGIKCRKEWKGDTLRHDDDAPKECFRKYNSPLDSYIDHSEFLKKGTRYAFLFDLEITDYKSWAHGLKKAGYATNPKYAEILIGVIERNNLQRFDHHKQIVKEIHKDIDTTKNITVEPSHLGLLIYGIPAVVAKEGETYASIAITNEMRVWQIYKYNDLLKSAEIKQGDTIYLKPKNYKGPIAEHLVQQQDNMHKISQRYGIKLSRLYFLNKMNDGEEPAIGEVVFLQNKRKSPPLVIPPIKKQDNEYFDEKIYDNVYKNIETSIPIMPGNPYELALRGIKEPMAFIHEVQLGETLFSISKKYNVQLEALRQLNNISENLIKKGDWLVVNPNQPKYNKNEESIVPGYHTVMFGETLYSIAKLYNTHVSTLKAINELESDIIRVGDELIIIPKHGEQIEEQKISDDTEDPVYYIVRENDTVYSISRKFGLNEEELRTINGLLENSILVGQRLRIR